MRFQAGLDTLLIVRFLLFFIMWTARIVLIYYNKLFI